MGMTTPGSLGILLPVFDVPVTALAVELQLPRELEGNFTRCGNLQQCPCHDSNRNCRSLSPARTGDVRWSRKGRMFGEIAASYAIEDQAVHWC
jgi:hypothetical protein